MIQVDNMLNSGGNVKSSGKFHLLLTHRIGSVNSSGLIHTEFVGQLIEQLLKILIHCIF